ncbi:MAG: bifunctional ornithine acetyltransferase/N-acetylglutamate synthase [Candidatus Hadarchaeales archaeon]
MELKRLKGGVTEPEGFLAAGVRAGVRSKGLDLALLSCEGGPVPSAGAFTTSAARAAPVILTMRHLRRERRLGAIVANSGCANSFTGERGLRDAARMAELTAELLGLKTHHVGVASTGMIGTYLPMEKVEAGIREAVARLSPSREASRLAAQAILTTDRSPKEVAVRVETEEGVPITIAGMAKGAGMIRPRLRTATMLVFLTTDAKVDPLFLRSSLQTSVDRSLNMITVDNDTSTNDMVLMMASGKAGNEELKGDRRFQQGLDFVLTELAKMIVKGAEGATRMMEVRVRNARRGEARKAALAVAGSNLLKAALFGGDPNWGRVVAALGYSGAHFHPSKLTLRIKSRRGEATLVEKGRPLGGPELPEAVEVMRASEIIFEIDLGEGEEEATAWGCDLSHGYVRINSRYRT